MKLPTVLGVPPVCACVFVIGYCKYNVESVCDIVAQCHGGQCHLLPCCPTLSLENTDEHLGLHEYRLKKSPGSTLLLLSVLANDHLDVVENRFCLPEFHHA